MYGIIILILCLWLKKIYCELMRNLCKYKGFVNKSVLIVKIVKFCD